MSWSRALAYVGAAVVLALVYFAVSPPGPPQPTASVLAPAPVPSDLIAALVSAVLDTPAEPIAGDADRLSEFGLDAPSARVTFDRPDAPSVTLSLGRTNPAETGVYARLDGNPQIVLLGLNVRYYVDMVLKQSGSDHRAASG